MAGKDDNSDAPLDRRDFFRKGLFRLFGHAEKVTSPFQKALERIGDLDKPKPAPPPAGVPASTPSPFHLLRPPGAGTEAEFAGLCSRCGKCVEVCPADAIQMDRSLPPERAIGGGLPYIDPAERSCVMCDSLACMNHCPSGALPLVPRFSIDLGSAVWGEGRCLRSEPDGTHADCRICADECPLGAAAIEVVDFNEKTERGGRIEVKAACTGCGVCQSVCPTSPKAIVIVPKARRIFPKER